MARTGHDLNNDHSILLGQRIEVDWGSKSANPQHKDHGLLSLPHGAAYRTNRWGLLDNTIFETALRKI